MLKALRAHGIDVVLEMRFTPGWANGDTEPNGIPTDGDDFANFATAVQNRFPWVRDYLIWNEPNKPLFLKPLSAEQYVKKILNPAYAALHAVEQVGSRGRRHHRRRGQARAESRRSTGSIR